MPQALYLDNNEALVVCDGRKLLILRNTGTRLAPQLKVEYERHRADAPTRDLGTERPGRVQPSVSTSASAVEQTDFHDMEEQAFLRGVVTSLEERITSGGLGSLVVAAPPRALGMLRKHYSEKLRQAIRTEIDRDFVDIPVADIQKRFRVD